MTKNPIVYFFYTQKKKRKKNRNELFSYFSLFSEFSPGLRLSQGSLGKARSPDRARFTRCLDK